MMKRPLAHRAIWGIIALCLSYLTYEAVSANGGLAIAVTFLIAPDLPGLLSIDPSLGKGQMHPRAVLPYNLLHHPATPAALLAILTLTTAPAAWSAAPLAWLAHIAIDRVLGYGLRTREGFQRDSNPTNSSPPSDRRRRTADPRKGGPRRTDHAPARR